MAKYKLIFQQNIGHILKAKKSALKCGKCGTTKKSDLKYFDSFYKKPFCFDCLMKLKHPITQDNEHTAYLIHKIEELE